jgi:hypothetical protein
MSSGGVLGTLVKPPKKVAVIDARNAKIPAMAAMANISGRPIAAIPFISLCMLFHRLFGIRALSLTYVGKLDD